MPSAIYRGRESGKMSTGAIIALVIVSVVLLGGAGCFFLMKFSFNMLEEQVMGVLATNPVIQEHIGEIQEVDFDLMGQGEVKAKDTLVFKVVGAKGKGKVTASFDDEFQGLLSGSLQMADGTVHPLLPTPSEEE